MFTSLHRDDISQQVSESSLVNCHFNGITNIYNWREVWQWQWPWEIRRLLHSISGSVKKMKLKESNKAGWEDHRKPRKDTVPKETAKEIVTFCKDGDISRDLPDVCSASIQNGKVQLRKVLQSSLLTTYEKYAETHGPKVNFSVFKQHQPQAVLPFTSHKYRECLCKCEPEILECRHTAGSLYSGSISGTTSAPLPQRAWRQL